MGGASLCMQGPRWLSCSWPLSELTCAGRKFGKFVLLFYFFFPLSVSWKEILASLTAGPGPQPVLREVEGGCRPAEATQPHDSAQKRAVCR